MAVVSILTRVSLLLADLIVIVATWIKVHSQVRESFNLRIESKTSAVMLTNGTAPAYPCNHVSYEHPLLQACCILCKSLAKISIEGALVTRGQGTRLSQHMHAIL